MQQSQVCHISDLRPGDPLLGKLFMQCRRTNSHNRNHNHKARCLLHVTRHLPTSQTGPLGVILVDSRPRLELMRPFELATLAHVRRHRRVPSLARPEPHAIHSRVQAAPVPHAVCRSARDASAGRARVPLLVGVLQELVVVDPSVVVGIEACRQHSQLVFLQGLGPNLGESTSELMLRDVTRLGL